MRVYVKNKLTSLVGSSDVLNEQDQVVFKIKGKFLSPTHKKRIYDVNNSLLYTVRDKYFTFFVGV